MLLLGVSSQKLLLVGSRGIFRGKGMLSSLEEGTTRSCMS